MIVFTSPLPKWPGSFSLPAYDDFDGQMWDAWRKLMSSESEDTLNRKFCYAGLSLIEKFGKWELEGIGLAEMRAWEKDKIAERIRLVSWVGRSIGDYIDELVAPKGLE